MKRKRLVHILIALIVVLGLFIGYRHYQNNRPCPQLAMNGGCLPEGMCSAPNDAIVSCEELKANPTKTDWSVSD